jgi:hypothetical protein
MSDDQKIDTSGKPSYEKNIPSPHGTLSTSDKQELSDKTILSYDAKDIQKYKINKPRRDIIYVKIVRYEEPQVTCIISKETKTTE